jgi:tetratricopeptide (TPR) repeat protein
MNYDYNKKQSIRDLSSLIRVSPFNYLAYYFRGVLYTETRKFEKAFADFQLIIKQTAANENSFAGQQSMLDKKIDLQNAGAYALTRIYGLPDEDSRKMKQAYCYLLISNFKGSIAVIDSTSDPNEPLGVYLQAVANEHMGNHEKALELYSDALALDNQIADAYKKRGIYRQNLEQWDNSIKDFNAVLALTPDAFIIYKLRGVSNYHAMRFKPAIDDFSTYLRHDSTNTEIMASRGMAYSQNKQWLEAYMDFAASGNLHALSYADMTKLVSDLLSRRDTVKSMKALKIFTTASPSYTEGYVLQLKVHLARKQWSEIDKELPRAIKHVSALTAKSDESYLYTLQALGEARKGLDDAALQAFDRAIQVDGKNKLAIQEKNKLLAKLGRSGEKTKNVAKSPKKSAADPLSGDWTLAGAEVMDGRKIGNYPPQRFIFTKNQIVTFDGFMENRIGYALHGNKLQIGVQVFTVESMSNREIRLVETETANPVRQIFVPTDSFTIAKKFQYTVNRETSDTVYTVSPGIEPQYKKENFMQDAFHMITQEVGFSFEFVVQKDGTVSDVKILTSSNEAQNKRFIQNLIKTSGSWIPGKIRGKPVSVKCETSMWRKLR